jgi:hypothetical protein
MTGRTGQAVPNQFIVWDDAGNCYYQSYYTVIARRDAAGKITLDRDKWDYSVTTGRYRNQFLGETTVETKAKISSGEYGMDDLNPAVH